MARGIDYSWSRPSPASIVAAGYVTVGRYLTSDTSGKRLTAGEAAGLQGAGLSIYVVFEDNADPLTNWVGISDHQKGVDDATIALGQANGLGIPGDRPIYVAVDTAQPIASKNAAYTNYFQGWVDTIGLGRVGLYGGGLLWSYLVGQGVVSGSWFWQAAAASWSNYRVPYPGADILQAVGSVLNGTSDEDTTFVADWGQWPAPTSVGPSPPPPPTAPGGTNTANTGISAAAYAQTSTHSLVTPNYANDQVIFSTTVTAAMGTGTQTGFYSLASGVNQLAYPIGLFTADGGATYLDFGDNFQIGPPAGAVGPLVTVTPVVSSSGVVSFNGSNSTGGVVSVTMSIALLASYAPSQLPSSRTHLGTNLSYSSFYPKLTADATTKPYATYRRIARDSHTGNNPSYSSAHSQTSLPNVMVWVQAAGQVTIAPTAWQSGGGAFGDVGLLLTGSNLAVQMDTTTYNDCFFRIYRDN